MDFGIRIFARYFVYHSPDLYRRSVVNAGDISMLEFSFSCFAVRLALSRIILYFSILAAVGWILSFLCAYFRLLMTSMYSSLNQIVLSFTGLDLLLGMVLFAMVHKASVKLATGSPALLIQSAFKSQADLSE